MRKSFESSIQTGLTTLAVDQYMVDFGQANFALEGDWIETRGLLYNLPVDGIVDVLLL